MTRDDIIKLVREAGALNCDCCLPFWEEDDQKNWKRFFVNFAALVAAAEREKVAAWMIERSYATGHGDTTEDLLKELEWQIRESEREACARVCDLAAQANSYQGIHQTISDCAAAIRARGEKT